jgi:hypothetical protein
LQNETDTMFNKQHNIKGSRKYEVIVLIFNMMKIKFEKSFSTFLSQITTCITTIPFSLENLG